MLIILINFPLLGLQKSGIQILIMWLISKATYNILTVLHNHWPNRLDEGFGIYVHVDFEFETRQVWLLTMTTVEVPY